MDGAELAKAIRTRLADEVRELGDVALATVLVGDDPASQVYIKYKHRACEEIGMHALDHRLPEETTEAELLDLVARLNADDGVDGILVQTPLPAHIDESTIIASVEPVKDVDGFSPENLGRLLRGEPLHVAATPLGIMTLLDELPGQHPGRPRCGDRTEQYRREAGRPAPSASERHGHDVPFADDESGRGSGAGRTSLSPPSAFLTSCRRSGSRRAPRSWMSG